MQHGFELRKTKTELGIRNEELGMKKQFHIPHSSLRKFHIPHSTFLIFTLLLLSSAWNNVMGQDAKIVYTKSGSTQSVTQTGCNNTGISATSYTVPNYITRIKLEGVGGGGGGGNATASSNYTYSSAGGGGGGAYDVNTITTTSSTSYTVSVAASVSAQTDGESSTIKIGSTTYLSANGGKKGSNATNGSGAGGKGGEASTRTGSKAGGYGGTGSKSSYSGGGGGNAGPECAGDYTTAQTIQDGGQGCTINGSTGSGAEGVDAGNDSGNDASSYGCGGSGASAYRFWSSNTNSGGKGAAGIIIISYTLDAPTIGSSSVTSRCGAGQVALTATAGTNGNTCKWYSQASGGTALHTGTSYSPTVNSTTTYYVSSYNEATAAEGSARTAVTVTIKPFPSVSISGATAICSGSSTTLTASGASSYQWNTGETTAAVTKSLTVATTYTVTGTTNGCSKSATHTVSVIDIPATATVTGDDNLCVGENISLSASSSSGTTVGGFVWAGETSEYITDLKSFTSAGSTTISTSTGNVVYTSTGADPMVFMYNIGNFSDLSNKYFQVRYKVLSGSPGQFQIFLSKTEGGTDVTTEGQSVKTNFPTPTGDWQYITIPITPANGWTTATGWRFDYCSNSGCQIEFEYLALLSKTNSATVNSPSVGQHKFYVTPVNYGCTNSTVQKIVTVNALPTISVNTTPPTSCNRADGQITVNASSSSSSSFTYSKDGGQNWASSATFSELGNGSYSVKAKDANGCVSSAENVTFNSQISVSLSANPATVCYGNNSTLTAVKGGASYGNVTYVWSDGTQTSTNTKTVTVYEATDYSVTATDASGCSASSSTSVDIYSRFSSGAIDDGLLTIATNTQPDAINEVQAAEGVSLSYKWQKDGADISGASGTTYTPNASDFSAANSQHTYTRWVKDTYSQCPVDWTKSTGDLTIKAVNLEYSLTVPWNAVVVSLECWGGGAGGTTKGGGGGGGGYAKVTQSPYITSIHPGDVITFKGAASVAAGNNGNNSTISKGTTVYVTATGGTVNESESGQGGIGEKGLNELTLTYHKGGNGGARANNRGGGGGGGAGSNGDGGNGSNGVSGGGEGGTAGPGGGGVGGMGANRYGTAVGGKVYGGGGGGARQGTAGTGASGWARWDLGYIPSVTITDPDIICDGGTLTFSDEPNVVWGHDTHTGQGWQLCASSDFSGTIITSLSNIGYEKNGWYVRYYATTPYGTGYSDPKQIVVRQKTTPQFSFDLTYCPDGRTITFPTTANNQDAFNQYIQGTWNPSSITLNNNTSATTNTTITFQPSDGICATSTQKVIKIYPRPAVGSISASPAAICAGGSFNLTSIKPSCSSVTEKPITGQGWQISTTTNPDGNYETFTNTQVSADKNGHYIRYYATSDCGTSYSTNTVKITVNDKPSVDNISSPAAICAGGNLDILAPTVDDHGSSSTGNRKWQISATQNGTFEDFQLTNVSLSKNGYYIRYYAKNTCGENYSNAVQITVKDTAKLTVTGGNLTQSVCRGKAITQVTFSSNTTMQASNLPNGVTFNATTGVLSGTPTETKTYTISTINYNSCGTKSKSGTITVKELPSVSITGDDAICSGTSTTLTASQANISSWSWSHSSTASSYQVTVSPNNTTTYTVTVTGTNSCTNTASKKVTVNAIPAAPTVTGNSRCGTGTVALSANPGSNANSCRWYAASTGGEPLATSTTYTTTSISSTTKYYVSSYNTETGCESTTRTEVTATVNPRPSAPTVTAVQDTVVSCGASSLTLAASPGSGGSTCRWYYNTPTGGTALTPDGNTYTITNVSTKGIYNYYASSVNTTTGCESSDRTRVVAVINSKPAISNVSPTNISCHDANDGKIVVTASSSAPTEKLYYSCTSNTSDETYQEGNTFNNLEAGTYTVKVKDNFGCITTHSSNVTINNPPALSVSLTALPASICQSESVTLTATASNAQGAVTYTWKNGTTTLGTTSTNTYTNRPTAASNSYSVGIKDGHNCTATSSSQSVTVKDTVKLVVSGSLDQSFCLGQSMSNVSVTDSTAAHITVSNLPAGVTYHNGKISGSPTAAGSSNVTITATSTNGCSAYNKTKTLKITVKDTVKLTVSGGNLTQSVCRGTAITQVTFSSNATMQASNLPNGVTFNATTGVLSGTPTETKTYTISTINYNSCGIKSKSGTITVKELPSVSITGADAICSGTSTTLTASQANISSWSWSHSSTASSYQVTVSPNNTTTYTVTVTGTNACTNTASKTVTVNATPGVPTASGNSRCGTGTVTLTATPASGANSCRWYAASTGGSPLSATPSTTYTTTSISSTTKYYVSSYNTETGCESTTRTEVTATVNPIPSAPPVLTNVTRAPDTFIVCGSNSITLTANPGTGNTCRWYNAGGTMVYEGNSYQINSLAAGIYDYTVSAKNTYNCESTNRTPAVAVIGVNPTITNVTHKDIRCHVTDDADADGRIEVTASYTSPASSLLYYRTPGGPQTSHVFDSLSAGSYTIKVRDNFGCETTWPNTVTIVNPEQLTVSLSASSNSVCQSESVTLTATASNAQGAVTYTWKNGTMTLGTTTTPTNTYTNRPTAASNSYSVGIKDGNNCTAISSSQSVTVKDTVKLVVSGSLDQSFCLGQSISNVTVSDSTAAHITVAGLPDGVSFQNGVISGSPTAAGSSNVIISAASNTGCSAYNKTKTLKITVRDTVKLTVSGNLSQSFCLGQSMTAVSITDSSNATISVTGLPEGVTYQNGKISGSPIAIGTSNVTITASSTTECPVSDKTKTLTISVKDTATLAHVSGNLNQTVCFGENITEITFSSNTTMSANPLPEGMSFTDGKLTGHPSTAGTHSYTIITNNLNDCGTKSISGTITMYPKVVMNPLPNDTVICQKKKTPAVSFSSSLPADSMTYTWSVKRSNTSKVGVYYADATSTPIPASGTGNFPAVYIKNGSYVIQTVTVSVVPHYGHGSLQCDGDTVKYIITVYPTITPKPSITRDTMCSGSSLTVSFGTKVTETGNSTYNWKRKNGNITGTGFIANKNYKNQTGINASNISTSQNTTQFDTITVTQNFTATGYGDVTCPGTAKIYIQVYPNPGMNAISPSNDQYICHDGTMNEVTLSSRITDGTMSYEWTRDNLNNIGGLRNGTSTNGKIKDSVLTNISNSEQMTTVSVRPIYTSSSNKVCRGSNDSVKTFKIQVNPQVKMTTVTDQYLCHNTSSTAVTLTSTITDGTMSYSWSRDKITEITGLAEEGSTATIAAATALNNTTTVQTTTYKVKPTYTNGVSCTMTGDSTFKITVYPSVSLAQVDAQYVSHDSIKKIQLQSGNSTDGSISYTWTRTTMSGVTGSENGSGNTLSDLMQIKLSNTNNEPKTVTFTVTPTYHNGEDCQGATMSFDVTVNPKVTMKITAPTNPNQTICSGTQIAAHTFGTDLTIDADKTIAYNWTRTTESGVSGLEGPGQGNIAATAMSNSNTEPKTVTFTVTPQYTANGITINGEKKSFTITVNPEVKMNPIDNKTLCDGESLNVEFDTQLSGGTMSYSWNRTNDKITGIGGLITPVTGNISAALSNSTLEAQTSTFTVVPTFTYSGVACTATLSNYKTFDVTVNKNPGVVSITGDSPICLPSSIELTASSTIPSAGSFVWSGENIAGTTAIFDGFTSTSNLRHNSGDGSKGTVELSGTGTLKVYSKQPENDLQIRWTDKGIFDPSEYKYIQVRYRTYNTHAAGKLRFYFYSTSGPQYTGRTIYMDYLNDGNWHVMTVDAPAENSNWLDYGNITGIRVDVRGNQSASYVEFDYIALLKSVNPLEISNPSVGSHTYYVAQVSPNGCGYSEAASKTVEVKELQSGEITSGNATIYPCGEYTISNSTLAQCTSTSDVKYKWTYTFNGGTEQDIAVNESSLTQESNLVSIPGVYVFKRYAASICTACTASGDAWKVSAGSFTLTVKGVDNPGIIGPNESTRRICAGGPYEFVSLEDASSEGDPDLHYKFVCTRIFNGVTTQNYRPEIFNINEQNTPYINTDQHPQFKLDETGLYIIHRYVWTGCDEGSAQLSDGEFRVVILNPEQNIPNAIESNYYEICEGGIVTLTGYADSAIIVVPMYSDETRNDTLHPDLISYQYNYTNEVEDFEPYVSGETPLSEPSTAYLRAQFFYENIDHACYATSEAIEIEVRNDPTFVSGLISSLGEDPICPNGEVVFTAGEIESTIQGVDQPYYYTWQTFLEDEEFRTVSNEATYTYENNGKIVHASNFIQFNDDGEGNGILEYNVLVNNALGCNANALEDEVDLAYVVFVPMYVPEAPKVSVCPVQGGSYQYTVDNPEEYDELRWYANATTTAYSLEAPIQDISSEGMFVKYVSQYSEDDECESARVPDTLVVRYTSHLSHVSGAMNQNLNQSSIYRQIPMEPIVFSYDGDARPRVVGQMPTGLSMIAENGIFTISGSPTVAGTFNFKVELDDRGVCKQPFYLEGVITVYPVYDTTVFVTKCSGQSYTVRDSRGHSYTITQAGTYLFGIGDKPLQTVTGGDSVLTVVYSISNWDQFGFETNESLLAGWTDFVSSSSISSSANFTADCGSKTGSTLSYSGWTSVGTGDDLGTSVCTSSANSSLKIPNKSGNLSSEAYNNNKTMIIRTSTAGHAYLKFSLDYKGGINDARNNASLQSIALAYSLDGTNYVETGSKLENILGNSGTWQTNLVEGMNNQENLWIRLTFDGAAAILMHSVRYLTLDNFAIKGRKVIDDVTLNLTDTTVCENKKIELIATPPDPEDETGTQVVNYYWYRQIGSGARTQLEEASNILNTSIPHVETQQDVVYTVEVGATGCSTSAQCVVHAEPSTWRLDIVRKDTVCASDISFYEYVPGSTIISPDPATITTAGDYICQLSVPVSEDQCDSIITLKLTVLKSYDTTVIANICLGETYTEHGFNITPTELGTATHYKYGFCSNGCDSVIILVLTTNSVKYTLSDQPNNQLVAWSLDKGKSNLKANCGLRANEADLSFGASGSGMAYDNATSGHAPSGDYCLTDAGANNRSLVFSNGKSECGGSWISYNGTYFIVHLKPKDYNNLHLKFDYNRETNESFSNIKYSYKLSETNTFIELGSQSLSGTNQWNTCDVHIPVSQVNTQDEEDVYLKVEFDGGSSGDRYVCRTYIFQNDEYSYNTRYFYLDNIVVIGDKPTRARLSTPKAFVDVSSETKQPGDSSEFCEGNDMIFTAQSDESLFENSHFTFWLRDSVAGDEEQFTTNTIRKNSLLYTTTWEVLARDENGCDSVFKFPVKINNSVHGILDCEAPPTCSNAYFSFTPQDGVHGVVPDNVTYSWDPPGGGDFIRGMTGGTDQTSIHGTLRNIDPNLSTYYPIIYTVTPSVNGCPGSKFKMSIYVISNVVGSITQPEDKSIYCPGETVSLNMRVEEILSSLDRKVVWSFNGETTVISGLSTEYPTLDVPHSVDLPYTCNTDYMITATYSDSAHCTVSDTITVKAEDITSPTYTRPKDTVLYVTNIPVAANDTLPSATGVPTDKSDICSTSDDMFTVTHRDSIVAVCGHAEKIYRIWRVADACGNVSVSDSIQFINVIDTVKLTVTGDTSQIKCYHASIADVVFGGQWTNLTISPSTLPENLHFTSSSDAASGTGTGKLSGARTDVGTLKYTVTATNPCDASSVTSSSKTHKSMTGTITHLDSLIMTVIVDSAECGKANGTIMASATGGSKPYSFKLDAATSGVFPGVFNNVADGDHIVRLADNLTCPYNFSAGSVTIKQLNVADIKGVTRHGEVTDFDANLNMVTRTGELDSLPGITQYGEVIEHDRTMANLTASATGKTIAVSVDVTKVADAHTLEFQCSTDPNFATAVYTKKQTNLADSTNYSHTFQHLTAGTYYVRAILRTCHTQTIKLMTGSVVVSD